jgi:hypothetical protein
MSTGEARREVWIARDYGGSYWFDSEPAQDSRGWWRAHRQTRRGPLPLGGVGIDIPHGKAIKVRLFAEVVE